MYKFLKKLFLTILPKSITTRIETPIRTILSVMYAGKDVQCNICSSNFRKFQQINSSDFLCVRCGSIPRQRFLFHYLNQENLLNTKTLHFSPNLFFSRKLKKDNPHYFTTEFETSYPTDFHFDVTKIDCEDSSYETVICYHVLEHIADDIKAMKELYRILAPNGSAILQVPFNPSGKTYEDYSIVTEKDRLEHFGQEDHVRIYGKDDFKQRLSSIGFTVKEIKTNEYATKNLSSKMGFNPNESVIICSK